MPNFLYLCDLSLRPLILTFCSDIISVNGNDSCKFHGTNIVKRVWRKDLRTDRRTDGQTDGQGHSSSCLVAEQHLLCWEIWQNIPSLQLSHWKTCPSFLCYVWGNAWDLCFSLISCDISSYEISYKFSNVFSYEFSEKIVHCNVFWIHMRCANEWQLSELLMKYHIKYHLTVNSCEICYEIS